MKPTIILTIILVILAGCSTTQDTPLSGTQELILNETDIQQLGMTSNVKESDTQLFELSNGSNCRTDNTHSNIEDPTLGQYNICVYYIPSLNNTQIIIEYQKFANYEALNGSYQYSSSHYYSIDGLISENTLGDQSRFRVNHENDYMGNLNEPGIYYYHLWFTKDLYLIHITSKGSQEAKETIEETGQQILSKID